MFQSILLFTIMGGCGSQTLTAYQPKCCFFKRNRSFVTSGPCIFFHFSYSYQGHHLLHLFSQKLHYWYTCIPVVPRGDLYLETSQKLQIRYSGYYNHIWDVDNQRMRVISRNAKFSAFLLHFVWTSYSGPKFTLQPKPSNLNSYI